MGERLCDLPGLVDDELAKRILTKCLRQMKEIGFTQYQFGLPTNLLPMQPADWSSRRTRLARLHERQHHAAVFALLHHGSLSPRFSR